MNDWDKAIDLRRRIAYFEGGAIHSSMCNYKCDKCLVRFKCFTEMNFTIVTDKETYEKVRKQVCGEDKLEKWHK